MRDVQRNIRTSCLKNFSAKTFICTRSQSSVMRPPYWISEIMYRTVVHVTCPSLDPSKGPAPDPSKAGHVDRPCGRTPVSHSKGARDRGLAAPPPPYTQDIPATILRVAAQLHTRLDANTQPIIERWGPGSIMAVA